MEKKSALINEYCEIAAGRTNQINDTSLIASLFILCDSVYHTVGTAKVPVYIASTGYLPDVPQDLSAYTPEASQIVVGNEFKVFSNDFIPFVQEEITAKDLFCKFKIADYDSALIPKMPDTYKVPNWVSNLAEYTEFYYSSDLSPELKPKNYLIFGGAGSGKTQGAMALASALGLPFYYINCSSNTDEAAFKGEIMPKLDNVNKTGRIEDFTSFKEEVEMSPEFAYKAITGIERSEVSEEECYAAYINLKAAEQAKTATVSVTIFRNRLLLKVFVTAALSLSRSLPMSVTAALALHSMSLWTVICPFLFQQERLLSETKTLLLYFVQMLRKQTVTSLKPQ